jgi:small-conductance mechanosensitive channel
MIEYEEMEISEKMSKQKEDIKKAMEKLSENSKIAERISKEKERMDSMKCKLARKTMYEALDMYEDGTFESWKDMVDDLSDTLLGMEDM